MKSLATIIADVMGADAHGRRLRDADIIPLKPEATDKEAMYILATQVGDHVNLSTFRWLPERQKWQSVGGRYTFIYLPTELAESKWQIVEKTTELVYDCRDIFGCRMSIDG